MVFASDTAGDYEFPAHAGMNLLAGLRELLRKGSSPHTRG